jgi:hypothetical protein
VHLNEVNVHEERLAAPRVLLDVRDGVIGLPNIERREGVSLQLVIQTTRRKVTSLSAVLSNL